MSQDVLLLPMGMPLNTIGKYITFRYATFLTLHKSNARKQNTMIPIVIHICLIGNT